MPTSACRLPAAGILLLLLASPALAQVQVDDLTEVSKIRFAGVESVHERTLRAVLKTRTRGSAFGLRAALGKLPLVPDPKRYPFSPLELQRDVVRLRGAYAAAGYFHARVRYAVERNDAKNLLEITFQVDEGRPLRLVEVAVAPRDSLHALPIADDQRRSWEHLEREVHKQRGHPLSLERVRKTETELAGWWRDRGHPLAVADVRFHADSAASEGHLVYRVAPGPSARFGEVRVEGTRLISGDVVRRQVRIEPGAPYSARTLEQAKVDVRELDIIRTVDVDVPSLPDTAGARPAPPAASPLDPATAPPPDSARSAVSDTTGGPPRVPGATHLGPVLPVRIRVGEAQPRLVSGDLGYVSDAGITSQARWKHSNFTGGGRALNITGLAQTGWLSLEKDPEIRYRAAVSLKQPAFLARRGSGLVTPFIEYRDDLQDRSTQYGLNTTYVYKFGVLRSISLDYQISLKDIAEYRFGDLVAGDIDLLTFLTQVSQGALDSLGRTLNISVVTLSGTGGRLDDPANPRRGFVIRPALQITAPTSWSSTAYSRVYGTASGFLPLGLNKVFTVRVAGGRLLPYGKSLPLPGEDPDAKFLQLRDVMFTAGGAADGRGWSDRLLGPKVPDVRVEQVGDSLVERADGYVPLGGFARASFTLELQLPMPLLGSNFGSHLFLDGGRIWSDDSRFALQGDPYGQEKFFYGAGAGLDLRTPVGPIRFSLGYKLNPSPLDLVDSDVLLEAVNAGTPLETLPRRNSRRWQVHLAIGTSH